MAAVGTAELDLATATGEKTPSNVTDSEELTSSTDSEDQESTDSDESTPLAEDDPRVAPLLDARETAHKAAIAKIEESHRQREGNARLAGRTEAMRQIQENIARVKPDDVLKELTQLVAKAADDGDKPDSAVLSKLVQAATAYGQVSQPDVMLAVMNQWLNADHAAFFEAAPKRPDVNDIWAAGASSGNPYEAYVAALRIAAIAGDEKGYARGKADAEKELREKAKAATKTEQIKAAGAAARSETSPTSVSGIGKPGRVLTMAQIEAYPMREWMELPLAERDRLRAAALQLVVKARR